MSQSNTVKKDSPFNNILFDVVLPALILSKLSTDDRLGPAGAVLLAFSIPLLHGLYGLWKDRKFGMFPIIGIVSVALSGGLSLLKIAPQWIAVKEAGIPAFLGCAVVFSLRTKYPLVRKMLFNDTILNMEAINQRLETDAKHLAVERLLNHTSWMIAGSFFLSSVLNYTLAKVILVSPPGTSNFNEELGKMQLMSYPVIVVPCMVVMGLSLWYLLRGIKGITGLSTESVLRHDGGAQLPKESPRNS